MTAVKDGLLWKLAAVLVSCWGKLPSTSSLLPYSTYPRLGPKATQSVMWSPALSNWVLNSSVAVVPPWKLHDCRSDAGQESSQFPLSCLLICFWIFSSHPTIGITDCFYNSHKPILTVYIRWRIERTGFKRQSQPIFKIFELSLNAYLNLYFFLSDSNSVLHPLLTI